MDNSCDEYDAYDLSEFSAADLVHIDHTAATTATRHDQTTTAPEEAAAVVVGTGVSGSLPRVAVALEPAADESVVVKVAEGGGSGSGDNIVVGDATRRRSPFEEFRPRGTLSVSDLVGPAWYVRPLTVRGWMTERIYAARCGVQFDYGLRQGRSLAPALRPESFVSAEGKEMKADKKVAKVNEKTLGRGRVGILSFDDLIVCLTHGFPTLGQLFSLFTKNWSVKYSRNQSELRFIWKKSTGRFGTYFHLSVFQ
jgi:hypothetical protein